MAYLKLGANKAPNDEFEVTNKCVSVPAPAPTPAPSPMLLIGNSDDWINHTIWQWEKHQFQNVSCLWVGIPLAGEIPETFNELKPHLPTEVSKATE